jgi:hypothetical protein
MSRIHNEFGFIDHAKMITGLTIVLFAVGSFGGFMAYAWWSFLMYLGVAP